MAYKFFHPDKKSRKISFSQCGEDLIIEFIFNAIKIANPTYLDIGAHDPFFINNTYLFYKKGSNGINVEPNPILLDKFLKYRPNDTNICAGVCNEDGEQDYYMMSSPSMNTFSEEEANKLESETSIKILRKIKIKTISLSTILNNYCRGIFPDFLSLDVEGLELDILKAIDFCKCFPKVICIETLTYSENKSEKKEEDIINYIKENGFLLYADTYINSIFVKKEIWQNR
ncbi:MAG: FkbM family methyltransferase [Thermodesulfobacteriota bacterium]